MPSPYRSLPPLATLRTFEAVARQLSFTRAAVELALTQSAVSHQISCARRSSRSAHCSERFHRGIELTTMVECFWTECGPDSTACCSPANGCEANGGSAC